jgi:hypothetical protein
MAQRNRYHGAKRQKPRAAAPPPARAVAAAVEKPRPVVYGKPFLVLEDAKKAVFVIKDAQLVAHEKTIAAYRRDSRVQEMPQKIKGLTRYEICSPLPDA